MNKKLTAGIATTILSFVFAFAVSAQTNAPSVSGDLKNRVKDLRQSIQNIRAQFEKESVDIKTKRLELDAELKNKRDEAEKLIKAVREEAKKAAETRRAELKDKINKLRDSKKKQIAARLDEQMARINTRWTDHFNDLLNQLSEILSKVELRADKASANGQNIAAVKIAIQNAKTAIESARVAVEAQAKKTYTATFSSEKDLGSGFKSAKDELKKDLFGLRDGAMKTARAAVQNAPQALKGVPKVDEENRTAPAPSQ